MCRPIDTSAYDCYELEWVVFAVDLYAICCIGLSPQTKYTVILDLVQPYTSITLMNLQTQGPTKSQEILQPQLDHHVSYYTLKVDQTIPTR